MAFSQVGQAHIEPQIAKRAAQYLRMSTDRQQYSTANQADAIARYAEEHGLTIVRTYRDDGKSGLSLQNRPALQQLIADAQAGTCDFRSVLIYDVSRWGRFQDVDESAYYEFICKEAGITIRYCAEQFENDGSPLAALIKSLKRAMAAEYSRELSVKVFAGQCRLVLRGFRVGGKAGYGFRRLLVGTNGKPKSVLKHGQRKSLTTDRVILIPGPACELAVVRRIYDLFVFKKRSGHQIAEILNGEGIASSTRSRWTSQKVFEILKNEKYIGNNVFNRTSQRLHQRMVSNPPEIWIRRTGCFAPVIDAKVFLKAKRIRESRQTTRGNEQYMLDCLHALLARQGRLSRTLIDADKASPTAATYKRWFGGLLATYQLIGYTPQTRSQLHAQKIAGQLRRSSAELKLLAHCAAKRRKSQARKRAAPMTGYHGP